MTTTRKDICRVPYSIALKGDSYLDLGNLGDFGSSMISAFSIGIRYNSRYIGSQNYIVGAITSSNTYILIMISPGGTGGGTGKLGIAIRDEASNELWINTVDVFNDGQDHDVIFAKGALNTALDIDIIIDGVSVATYIKRNTGCVNPINFDLGVAIGANTPTVAGTKLSNTLFSQPVFWKNKKVTEVEAEAWYKNDILPADPFTNYPMNEGGDVLVKDEQGNHDGTLSSYGMWSFDSPKSKRVTNILANYPSVGLARCHQYDIDIVEAAPNQGNSNTAEWDYLQAGWSERCRQNGTVRSVKAYIHDTTAFVSLKITQWRLNDTGFYDLVQVSEDIIPSMVSGSTEEHTFISPFIDVQLGDFFGHRMRQTAGNHTLRAVTGLGFNYGLKWSTSVMPDSNANWGAATVAWQLSVPFEIYIDAPQAVFIGDSIMAGHNEHKTFTENGSGAFFKPETAIPYKVTKLLSGNGDRGSFQNMGIGAQTTSQIRDRFLQDVVDSNAKLVFANGGVNDIYLSHSLATIIAAWNDILGMCETAGITIYIHSLLPYPLSTTLEANSIEEVNTALAALVDTYDFATFVQFTSSMGKFRVGGTAGNRWDMPLVYSDPVDFVHPVEEGYKVMAETIYRRVTV